MTSTPLEVYAEGLLADRAAEGPAFVTWLHYSDGRRIVLDLPRWIAPASAADQLLLARCAGPTLDIGCGPGRLTRALVARGIACLGVDVAPEAVALASTGGMPILHASIFDPALDDSRWATVLLADGNIGIGGDPTALLARARDLCTANLLVEVDGPETATAQVQVRIENSTGHQSRWFPWAHVSATDVPTVAARAGLSVSSTWTADGRYFAELVAVR